MRADTIHQSKAKTVPEGTDQPSLGDVGLYGALIFVWGTSWYAMKLQVGEIAPHVSLVWRFGLASLLMFLLVLVTRRRLRYNLQDHGYFLALGVFLFSSNFALFYYGAQWIPSGLLAVVFSLASLINIALAFGLYGVVPSRSIIAGAICGVVGVALLFWPEIAGADANAQTFTGLIFCVLGTLSFCIGNLFSAKLQRRHYSLMATNMWGMIYGTGVSACVAALMGAEFRIDWTPGYIGSLLWLTVFSTIIAFWSYLTLLGRIGAAKAGYATVLFPIVALLISTVLEDYSWTVLAGFGVLAAMAGNVLVLRGRSTR